MTRLILKLKKILMPPEHWISYLQCCDKNNHCIHITKLLIEHTHTIEDPAQLSVCRGARLYGPVALQLLPRAASSPALGQNGAHNVLLLLPPCAEHEGGKQRGREGGSCCTCRLAHGNNKVVVFPVSLRWSHCIHLQVKCVSVPIKFNSTMKPVPLSQHLETLHTF